MCRERRRCPRPLVAECVGSVAAVRDHWSRLYKLVPSLVAALHRRYNRAMPNTLGYHYVKSTYGQWLPGDDRGSWSEAWDERIGFIEPHMLHPGDPIRRRMAEERMKHDPVRLLSDMIRCGRRRYRGVYRSRCRRTGSHSGCNRTYTLAPIYPVQRPGHQQHGQMARRSDDQGRSPRDQPCSARMVQRQMVLVRIRPIALG